MTSERATTGIAGLDLILGGGLPRDRIYLVEGDPGVGKTTLALQFLLDGIEQGDRGLYITLSETEPEVRAIAASHGWSLDKLSMFELSALGEQLRIDAENTIFHPSDVELTETTRAILAFVEKTKPARIVFDSLSELRLLSQSALRFRREVLNLKQYFTGRNSTVILLDDRTSEPGDMQLQSLAHGVIAMHQMPPEYGGDRRRLRVSKLRGAQFSTGYHDFQIRRGGLEVFPRLVAADHHVEFAPTSLSSEVPEIDSLLGGGLSRGSSTIVMGPAGAGKSVLSAQFVCAAARRGTRSVVFVFDELRRTLINRADGLGMEMSRHIDAGTIIVQQIDPAEMSPGELAARARDLAERERVELVVIDSLNGYMQSMPAERYLYVQLHELLTYFGQLGVTTVMLMAQSGLVGQMGSPADVSYIADSVILMRYFETAGRVRKAISVIKKRTGAHEDTIRELSIDSRGIHVGEPLSGFRGVLASAPELYTKAGV
jgi:circadian clock protein KaiC